MWRGKDTVEDLLKPKFSDNGIVLESIKGVFLNNGREPGYESIGAELDALVKLGAGRVDGLVNDALNDHEQVIERQVDSLHLHVPRGWVDGGVLERERIARGAEDALDERGHVLPHVDQALGLQVPRRRVDAAAQNLDMLDMRRLVVRVLAPAR
ncbi:hypothetical protein AYI69_g164 [Smittium culicis]|uniref:Uncharacterized protein n=1 Tax=Smittium culicis TaxID=133412 RepID=A0A1R1YU38_9FUNG|nr:hypothetical protein AYI69_g164 [Smittium culicis]